MEQTNTTPSADQQAGPVGPGSTRPRRPDVPAAPEGGDSTTPPAEPDTGFEPV
jgi:hypothetical protein